MDVSAFVRRATGASRAVKGKNIQTLWGGYGHIIRYHLTGTSYRSVIVKHVKYPGVGTREALSDARKRRSYHVEAEWYRSQAGRCDILCPVPRSFGVDSTEREMVMVLEDLDEAGYPLRLSSAGEKEREACLRWLASFHALFLGEKPQGLWETGTYWHLETRPEELTLLEESPLKWAAPLIDRKLKETPYPTIVHGDAKLANFCLSRDRTRAAALDFQYVGGGCGMKDLAYLAGDCFYYDRCEKNVPALLDSYFAHFRKALAHYGKKQDADRVEVNWRELFPYAWADFHRFLKGWTPGRWDREDYSERISRKVAERCLSSAGGNEISLDLH